MKELAVKGSIHQEPHSSEQNFGAVCFIKLATLLVTGFSRLVSRHFNNWRFCHTRRDMRGEDNWFMIMALLGSPFNVHLADSRKCFENKSLAHHTFS
jgi:hypothetical protein